MPELTSEKYDNYCIAFYNLENLFDTVNDPKTLDDDFTEDSEKNWNERRLKKKLRKLAKVITKIGKKDIGFPPVLLGVAEVENSSVLDKLINTQRLKKRGYKYVHFDSPDERGIDTALLYRKELFKVLEKKVHGLFVTNEAGERDYTRDILHVFGLLEEEPVHILVNHWPSRRSGAEETSYKRIKAAEKNIEIISNIVHDNPSAKIIVMGDFNDDPHNESIQKLTETGLYNPMDVLLSNEDGSLGHR